MDGLAGTRVNVHVDMKTRQGQGFVIVQTLHLEGIVWF